MIKNFRFIFLLTVAAAPAAWLGCTRSGTTSAAQVEAPAGNRINEFWTDVARVPGGFSPAAKVPTKYRLLWLDLPRMRQHLAAGSDTEPKRQLVIPMPDSSLSWYEVSRISLPQTGYSRIGYQGKGIDNPNSTIRITLTHTGLHAQIQQPEGVVYVEPCQPGDSLHYFSYKRSDLNRLERRAAEKPVTVPND